MRHHGLDEHGAKVTSIFAKNKARSQLWITYNKYLPPKNQRWAILVPEWQLISAIKGFNSFSPWVVTKWCQICLLKAILSLKGVPGSCVFLYRDLYLVENGRKLTFLDTYYTPGIGELGLLCDRAVAFRVYVLPQGPSVYLTIAKGSILCERPHSVLRKPCQIAVSFLYSLPKAKCCLFSLHWCKRLMWYCVRTT